MMVSPTNFGLLKVLLSEKEECLCKFISFSIPVSPQLTNLPKVFWKEDSIYEEGYSPTKFSNLPSYPLYVCEKHVIQSLFIAGSYRKGWGSPSATSSHLFGLRFVLFAERAQLLSGYNTECAH